MNKNIKKQKRDRRHVKIRTRIFGTAKMPRLAVFRSNKFMYAQLIDDDNGRTLVSASSLSDKKSLKGGKAKDNAGDAKKGTKKMNAAIIVGKTIAEKALAMKIESVVFDRGGFGYRGQVKALAEGARSGGLKF
ncbi:MAG: 50S ribosomal protein L18 [Patescibacteria group bacterium]